MPDENLASTSTLIYSYDSSKFSYTFIFLGSLGIVVCLLLFINNNLDIKELLILGILLLFFLLVGFLSKGKVLITKNGDQIHIVTKERFRERGFDFNISEIDRLTITGAKNVIVTSLITKSNQKIVVATNYFKISPPLYELANTLGVQFEGSSAFKNAQDSTSWKRITIATVILAPIIFLLFYLYLKFNS